MGDYISRDEAIFAIDGELLDSLSEGMAKEILEMLPAADVVERKIGQWEEIRVMPEAYDITGEKTWASVMRCNKCGFEAFAIEGHFAQYHFCPNCGSDMRGGNER